MFNRAGQWVRDAVGAWGVPILMGLTTASAVWSVWYVTKAPCTTLAAVNGLCNLGVAARFINLEILFAAGGAALAVGALKGGYDRYMMRNMINQEREARQASERHLAEQIAEQRKRSEETIAMLTEMFNDLRAERQREAEERQREAERRQQDEAERRQQDEEERQIFLTTQQALLDTIARLAQGNGNGNGRLENDGG